MEEGMGGFYFGPKEKETEKEKQEKWPENKRPMFQFLQKENKQRKISRPETKAKRKANMAGVIFLFIFSHYF